MVSQVYPRTHNAVPVQSPPTTTTSATSTSPPDPKMDLTAVEAALRGMFILFYIIYLLIKSIIIFFFTLILPPLTLAPTSASHHNTESLAHSPSFISQFSYITTIFNNCIIEYQAKNERPPSQTMWHVHNRWGLFAWIEFGLKIGGCLTIFINLTTISTNVKVSLLRILVHTLYII